MKKEIFTLIISFIITFICSGENLFSQTPPDNWKGKISETMRAHNFPEYKPFFRAILSDGQGLTFVLRKLSFHEEFCVFDLFNSAGIFIYRIHTPSFPVAIKNGYFYQPRHDQEKGIWIIQRFKIKNWGVIKASSN